MLVGLGGVKTSVGGASDVVMDYYQHISSSASQTYFDTDGGSYVDVTNGLNVSQAGMVNGDTYLVVYKAFIGNVNNGTVDFNGFKLIGTGGGDLTRSEMLYDSSSFTGTFSLGVPYFYAGTFTANTAGANIKAQHVCPGVSGDYCYENGATGLILNLDSDVPNHVKSSTTSSTNLDSTSYKTLGASVTLGSDDWVVIMCARANGATGNTYFQTSIYDGTTDYAMGGIILESTANDDMLVGGMAYFPSFSGTLTVRGKSSSATVYPTMDYAFIVALPLSDFKEAYAAFDTNTTPTAMSAVATDETCETLSVGSMTYSTDHGIIMLGGSHNWSSTQECIGFEVHEQKDGGGYSLRAGNNNMNPKRTTNTYSYNGDWRCGAPATYVAGSSYDWINYALVPAGTASNFKWVHPSIVYLNMVRA